jgi:hypothetical protein
MNRHASTFVFMLTLLVSQSGLSFAAEQIGPEGCRLASDDPLRGEIDQMMQEGDAFEENQRLALQEKVELLGQARGWSKRQEHEFLKNVLVAGLADSWDSTLTVAARFITVCEGKSDGTQRARAVEIFRQLYFVQEQQWKSMHDLLDEEIASVAELPAKP